MAVSYSFGSYAEEVPGIIVNKGDGSKITVVLSDLRSIKFSEGNMVINMKDEVGQTVSLDEIESITFEDVVTAINTLSVDAKDDHVVVTDLAGRIIYKGRAESARSVGGLHGIYIITVNGKSHKVSIGK